MANYHIQNGGTKTTGESVATGESAWIASNCYDPSILTDIAHADGNTFVFDETVIAGTLTAYETSAAWILTKGGSVGTRFGGAGGGGASLELASGGSTIFVATDSAALMSISDLTLTNENITANMLYLQASTVTRNTALTRVKFVGSGANTSYALRREHGNGTFSMVDCSVTGLFTGTTVISGQSAGGAANDSYSAVIDNLTVNITAGNLTLCTVLQFRKADTADNAAISLINSSITVTAATAYLVGFRALGYNTVNVDNNNISVTTPSTSGSFGIEVSGNTGTGANRTTVNPIVTNNKVLFDCKGGHGIMIGADSAAVASDLVQDAEVHHNEVTGPILATGVAHGITGAALSSGKFYANTINRCHQGLLFLYCDNDAVLGYGNHLYDNYDCNLSFEGNTGGIMANNTVIIAPSSVPTQTEISRGIWGRKFGVIDNTGGKAHNNNIIVLGDTRDGMFAEVGVILDRVGDSLEFKNNNYYTDQVIPSNAWHYNNNTYSSVASWNAGEGTDETNEAIFSGTVAEIMAGFGADLDKCLADSSSYGGGLKWFSGSNPETLREPVPDIDIDRGVPSKGSPLYPK